MRLFAKDNLKEMLGKAGMKDGEPLQHRMLTGSIERAQKRVEERNFDIRKHLLEYDDVLNEQRNFIYQKRDDILGEEHILQKVLEYCHKLTDGYVDEAFDLKDDNQCRNIVERMDSEMHLACSPLAQEATREEWKEYLHKTIDDEVMAKVAITTEKPFNDFLRFHFLRQIDIRWQDHLSMLEELREAVGLRSYAQKNPLVEYKLEGFDIFNQMLENIEDFMAFTLVNVRIREKDESYDRQHKPAKTVERHTRSAAFQEKADQAARQTQKNRQSDQGQTKPVTIRRTYPKVGRNDPCPCGSGKKYKNCHGRHM
jgi:preprotein translocase subunit SecA